MDSVWQDIRLGLRSLLKRPSLSLAAVLTLAIGIGAATTVYSVVQAVVLRPLPFPEPDELVVVWEAHQGMGLPRMYAAPPNFADWKEHNHVFASMGLSRPVGLFLDQNGEPQRVAGGEATAGLFEVLGASVVAGRLFGAEDDRAGAPAVALLGHGLWQRQYGADRAVVGRSVVVDGKPRVIVGVLAPGFHYSGGISLEPGAAYSPAELWIPYGQDPADGQRGAHYLTALARLLPGVSIERAQVELQSLAYQLEEQYPESNAGWSVALAPLSGELLGDSRTALLVLLAAVGLVLLIACVNVAGLLLARNADRSKELAVRAALGASRGRILQQVLVESLILAGAGAAMGLLCARVGLEALLGMAPHNIPRLEESGLNTSVVLFALGMTLVSGVLAGVAPAWLAQTASLQAALASGPRIAGAGAASSRVRRVLVVAEVALSAGLLVGAGLMLRTLVQLRGVDPGFQPEQVLTARITLPETEGDQRKEWSARFTELARQLESLPGVSAAGLTYDVPLAADRQGTELSIEGEPEPAAGLGRHVNFTFVTPGYFDALSVPLRAGRRFNDADRSGAEEVVLINEALARRWFRGQDPIGKRVAVGFNDQLRRIVGVVGDERHESLTIQPQPGVYIPHAQFAWSKNMFALVRSGLNAEDLERAVRARVHDTAPGAAVYEVRSMEQVLSASMAQARFLTILMSVFAQISVLLATVGMYGLLSYSVTQRAREIGVRMALGAQRPQILGLILGQGLRLILVGIIIGLAGALGLSRWMSSLLWNVAPTDPTSFCTAALLLAAVSVMACAVPARRAMRLEPLVALRSE